MLCPIVRHCTSDDEAAIFGLAQKNAHDLVALGKIGEDTTMLKQVTLLKRKPGLSRAEFIDYYERHHSKLAERFLWRATRYQRRYVQPCVNPITGDAAELDFDVVMEIWWASRPDFDLTMAEIGGGEAHLLLWEDEEQLFNSHDHRTFTVEEYETDMEAVRAVNS